MGDEEPDLRLRARRLLVTDLGLRVSLELATEPAALVAALEGLELEDQPVSVEPADPRPHAGLDLALHRRLPGLDVDELIFAQLDPRRAAYKRAAIAQRRRRVARQRELRRGADLSQRLAALGGDDA